MTAQEARRHIQAKAEHERDRERATSYDESWAHQSAAEALEWVLDLLDDDEAAVAAASGMSCERHVSIYEAKGEACRDANGQGCANAMDKGGK
jgi:cystathionine beta-lyase/cystathionine gamma-synthase